MIGYGRGENGSHKTTELHVDPLKKLSTSNKGILYIAIAAAIVAENSHRGVGGGGGRSRSTSPYTGTHLGGQLEI